MTKPPELYANARNRLLELAATLDQSRHEVSVPALPLWTVRETYAHVSGVAVDVLAGNDDGLGTPAWSAAQVNGRADLLLADICAEWAENVERFDARMRDDQAAWGSAFDLWMHEQDIRAALGEPVNRDEDSVRFGLDCVSGMATSVWPQDTPAVRLVADDLHHDWQLGEGTPETTVHASGYELLRAATGRRSRGQVEALGWQNPAPHLAYVPIFAFAEADLVE